MDLVQWIPMLTALGVGSVIGNWFGGGRARRELRGGVLKALATTETARWAGLSEPSDYKDLRAAAHDLETAALIARIPRQAVHQYLIFAQAARRLSVKDYEDKGGDEDVGAGGIDADFAAVVRESAEIITRLAWSPWWSRIALRRELEKVRTAAAIVESRHVKQQLSIAQYSQGRLPGPLGELVDEWFPKA